MRIILWMMPAGMGWVRVNRLNPAVAAMGLAAGLSSSLNTAAANLANAGDRRPAAVQAHPLIALLHPHTPKRTRR